MKQSRYLRAALTVAACAAVLAGTAGARTRKGDKLFKQAQRAETERNWDQALNLYDAALAADPTDPNYLIYNHRIHATVAQVRLDEGRALQKEQKVDQALAEFQKAFLADPSNQAVLQEIRATTIMLRERSRNPNAPVLTPAERARQEVERRINSLEGPPTLRPLNDQINSLRVNNQPARVLYESVCKLAGINLLSDPQGLDSPGAGNRNYNLDLNNVTLQEALNYVAIMTHTFWKPISRNAIFVTQESAQKRQEYQDELVKVFYIQNASTPNEFSEIFNGVRTGAKLTSNVFQVASQYAIIARGSPDTISLVEKLVHDLDKPKSEVTMDILILEVNKTRASTIGAALLGQGGLTVPFNFTPRNPTTLPSTNPGTGTGGTTPTTPTTPTNSTNPMTTIANLGHLSSADFSATLPNTVVNALLNDSTTRILQRPQLRSTDGGKASLKIALKVPYVSGSLNSAVATPGSVPYATTQFTSVDVGTIVDFQPHVNGAEDISMRVHVELSTVVRNVNIAGIDEPEIGQQTDEADVRMRDGEVSILGGLSDQEKALTLSGLPGFTDVPGLNYLFGSKAKTDTDNQILIAIIPHIIRSPELGDGSQGIFAGTETIPRVLRGTPVNGIPVSGVPGGLQPVPNQPVPSRPRNVPPNVPVYPQTVPVRPPNSGAPPPPQMPQQQ